MSELKLIKNRLSDDNHLNKVKVQKRKEAKEYDDFLGSIGIKNYEVNKE